MAYAMQHSPESQSSSTVQNLSHRWLSYVASQYVITDDLLITLQQLVPRREYASILEDLMWRAAFHADRTSFERGRRNQQGRGALERRLTLLEPLASGDVRWFSVQIRDGLNRSPSEVLRFLDQLVERLEREDGDVRADHVPTLMALRVLLEPLSPEAGQTGRQSRNAADLLARTQAILEGLGSMPGDTSSQARSLSPTGEVFAGSVRLAPSDPLPWPFRESTIPAPSVFSPLTLTPEEWRGEDGEWVFGWSISG